MPPKTSELDQMLRELRELVEAGDAKRDAADTRTDQRLTDLEGKARDLGTRITTLEGAPRVPDTGWTVMLGFVREVSKDARTMQILIGGTLVVILVLGLGLLNVIGSHPEIVPGYISVQADK